MTKRGYLTISAELLKKTLHFPDDMEISKIELSGSGYTIDIYGFSETFPEVPEGCLSLGKTLQWV